MAVKKPVKTVTEPKATPKTDGGISELQSRVNKEIEQGYVGVKVDPRPNSDYTAPRK